MYVNFEAYFIFLTRIEYFPLLYNFIVTECCVDEGFIDCFWHNSAPPPSPIGQSLLIREVCRSHITTRHSRYDFSGRVIRSSQRPLPDKTQNTHNKNSMPHTVGFEPTISAGERLQT